MPAAAATAAGDEDGRWAKIWGEVPQYQAIQGQHEFKQAEISDKLRRQARSQDGGVGLLPGSIR